MIDRERIMYKRQGRWDQMFASFDGKTPRIPVDQKVRGLVVALNSLGIETTNSCEGHRGRRGNEPVPWISFDVERFYDIDHEQGPPSLKGALRFMRNLPKIIGSMSRRIEPVTNLEVTRAFLGEFYSNRGFNDEAGLVVVDFWGMPEMQLLINQGGIKLHEYNEHRIELSAGKLRCFQKEMKDFGDFLGGMYFDLTDRDIKAKLRAKQD